MKEFKYPDFKKSHFLKLHNENVIKKWHDDQKQAELDEVKPFFYIGLLLVVIIIWVYLDPLTWRFIFQGY